MSLASLNLNNLVSLDALLRDRNVSKAAARMGVTQSAMSHTLRALREMLGDPLLVRVGNEMVLTPFAEQVQVKLQRGLTELESVVSGRAAFDPSTITDTFTVATIDAIAALFAAPLLDEITREAPGAKLRIVPVEFTGMREQLGDRGVDIVVMSPLLPTDGLQTEPFGPLTTLSVVCRRDHPVINKRVSPAQFCRLPHAILNMTGDGPSYIDAILEREGKSRTVVARVPYLASLAEILTTSDCLTSLPTVVGLYLAERWPLTLHTFPFSYEQAPLLMFWHPRFEADPSHLFLRSAVRRAAEQIGKNRPGF